jgi:hypothetical protein
MGRATWGDQEVSSIFRKGGPVAALEQIVRALGVDPCLVPLDSIVSSERGTLTIRVQDGATCEDVGSGRLITYRLEQVER